MVDRVEADRGLLDEQAVAHVLQHPPVDAVLVALVGDDQVRLLGGLQHGLLGWRVGHQDDLDLVSSLEKLPHGFLAVGAQAGDPGSHGS